MSAKHRGKSRDFIYWEHALQLAAMQLSIVFGCDCLELTKRDPLPTTVKSRLEKCDFTNAGSYCLAVYYFDATE